MILSIVLSYRERQCHILAIFSCSDVSFQSFICFLHSNPFKVKVPDQLIDLSFNSKYVLISFTYHLMQSS